jgi:hypothetical protein
MTDGHAMSWPRAVLSGLVIVAGTFALLVVVPDAILSQITDIQRGGRVALATAWFAAAWSGLLWGLRRLQSRRVI